MFDVGVVRSLVDAEVPEGNRFKNQLMKNLEKISDEEVTAGLCVFF